MLVGGVELGGPFDSLAPPWFVSGACWPDVTADGVDAFAELTAPGACSPSGAQA